MKTLVKHVRVDVRGQRMPVATIVAVGPEQIGFAVCNLKDHFVKARGVHIATERAMLGVRSKIPNRVTEEEGYCFGTISFKEMLDQEIGLMKSRAKRYFKVSN